jgi:asparagine N-glycosylation enzyme membrane subunit Stt3
MMRLTIFLGRLLGLFFVLFAIAMLVNRRSTSQAAFDFTHDPPALMLAGILALVAGLAIVLSHNRWSGGALTVVVTILGWIFVVRGTLILALPRELLIRIYEKMNFNGYFYLYAVIPLAIGIYLLIASFTSSSEEG